MMHALHPRRRTRRPYYGAEEEEEVGADLNGSAGLFGCVHCLYRSNPPAPVRCRPIRLLHDQHRPDLPPDRLDDSLALAEASQRDGIMLAPGTVFRPHLERSPWMRFNVAVCEDTRVQRWLQRQAANKAA